MEGASSTTGSSCADGSFGGGASWRLYGKRLSAANQIVAAGWQLEWSASAGCHELGRGGGGVGGMYRWSRLQRIASDSAGSLSLCRHTGIICNPLAINGAIPFEVAILWF